MAGQNLRQRDQQLPGNHCTQDTSYHHSSDLETYQKGISCLPGQGLRKIHG
jgi:hypothetical protein